MSCAYDKERLTAFFDGELDAAERAETERHISGCSECLRDLGEIKSAASAVKTLSRPRAPRGIAEAVAREIAVTGRVRRIDAWRGRLLVGVAAAAAVLILLNVTYFMTPPSTPRDMAKTASPAPVVGLVGAKEAEEDRKAPQREAAKAVDALQKDAVDKRVPADGNRARDVEAGRELKKADADRAPGENALRQDGKPSAPAPETPLAAKAPAPSAPAKPQAAPPAEPKTEAPLAGAPTPRPPAADPAAKAAPSAEKSLAEEGRRKLDEKSDKAAELRKQVTGDPAARQTAAPLPEVPAYTVRGGKAALVRAQAEALAKKWSAPEAAAKAGASSAPPAPAAAPRPSVASSSRSFGAAEAPPLVLDVTPEQLEELRKELAAAGVTIEAGAPELLRGAGKDAASGGGALANKERAEQKDAVEAEKKSKTESPTRRITLHFVELSSLRARDK